MLIRKISLGNIASGCLLHSAVKQVHALVGPPRGVFLTMSQHLSHQELPRAQILAERILSSLVRILRIEAVSGAVLLTAAMAAVIWANSPLANEYHALWETPLTIGVGSLVFSQSLHFWINDALMTIFFLVVGMEVRREVHGGTLTNLRQASLPIAAALGGVVAPALIYVAFNSEFPRYQGWAVPMATDIAFALGVLALLGRAVSARVRVFLLTLAIVDDIIAVLIIALFYGEGLDYGGLGVAGLGVCLLLGLQRIGVGTALAYVLPGGLVWAGLLMAGVNPTLSGVILGLMTPVRSVRMRERPVKLLSRMARELAGRDAEVGQNSSHFLTTLRALRLAQRELQPPAVRVQASLQPWVAYGVMPLFALANAGVGWGSVELASSDDQRVVAGVMLALVFGKPLGVVVASWLGVRWGGCRLPPGLGWGGIWLIGLLAGIGFTMSIFIATLAFDDEGLVSAAKLGVLLGTLFASLLGLSWGWWYGRRLRAGSAGIERGAVEAG